MPLQNRIDPSGDIHAVSARGLFTGNRGVIHNPETRTLTRRRWTTKAWIICQCEYKGRKRDVFGYNSRSGGPGWTNLFFLDEVTALAAGHRPCFECRRTNAIAFAACFARPQMRAAEMDTILHCQRLAAGASPIMLDQSAISMLPEGAIIKTGQRYLAKKGAKLLEWSFDGYGAAFSVPHTATLVTPSATITALRNGYRPVWHSSALQSRA